MKNVILAGMKHSGKSTLGKRLATHWDWAFQDLDDLLAARDPENRGWNAREIYRTLGKQTFMDWEAQAAALFASQTGPRVLALGGGTIENSSALKALENSGIRVYLKEDPGILYSRIIAGGLPAFLSPDHPREDFQALFEKRTALLETWCDLTLDLQGDDIRTAFNRLLGLLKEYNHAR